MPAHEERQLGLQFWASTEKGDGYSSWHEQRAKTLCAISKQIGLPLGHRVQVWLNGEIRLEGMLSLKESMLFPETLDTAQLELVVDGTPFKRGEIASCIRLD